MLLIQENSFPKADYNNISDYTAGEEFYPFPIGLISKPLKTFFIGHKRAEYYLSKKEKTQSVWQVKFQRTKNWRASLN